MNRIEKLESQVRLQRYIFAGFCVLLLVAAKAQHAEFDSLKAATVNATQSIAAVDPKTGEPRAATVVWPTSADIFIQSPDKKTEIRLTAADGLATFSMSVGNRRLTIDRRAMDKLNELMGLNSQGYPAEKR